MERFRLSTAVYFPKRRVSPRAHTAARGISQGLSGCKVTGSSIDACGSLMKRRWPFRLEPFPLPLPPTPSPYPFPLPQPALRSGCGTFPQPSAGGLILLGRAFPQPSAGGLILLGRAFPQPSAGGLILLGRAFPPTFGWGGPIRGCPVQLVTVRRYG